jgi:hypothetical protein
MIGSLNTLLIAREPFPGNGIGAFSPLLTNNDLSSHSASSFKILSMFYLAKNVPIHEIAKGEEILEVPALSTGHKPHKFVSEVIFSDWKLRFIHSIVFKSIKLD